MQRLRTIIAATAIAVVALVASPMAASASTIYPPSGSCTANPTTVTPGSTVVVECDADTFSADEDVTVTVTGENGSDVTIGFVRFAISTASGHVQSEADGSIADLQIAFPSSASGTYNIAAVSATSAGSTAAVTVANADGSLPSTGLDGDSLMWVWIGGAVLLLAGGALAAVAFVRRRREQ